MPEANSILFAGPAEAVDAILDQQRTSSSAPQYRPNDSVRPYLSRPSMYRYDGLGVHRPPDAVALRRVRDRYGPLLFDDLPRAQGGDWTWPMFNIVGQRMERLQVRRLPEGRPRPGRRRAAETHCRTAWRLWGGNVRMVAAGVSGAAGAETGSGRRRGDAPAGVKLTREPACETVPA
jgi:hypothetical protein